MKIKTFFKKKFEVIYMEKCFFYNFLFYFLRNIKICKKKSKKSIFAIVAPQII